MHVVDELIARFHNAPESDTLARREALSRVSDAMYAPDAPQATVTQVSALYLIARSQPAFAPLSNNAIVACLGTMDVEQASLVFLRHCRLLIGKPMPLTASGHIATAEDRIEAIRFLGLFLPHRPACASRALISGATETLADLFEPSVSDAQADRALAGWVPAAAAALKKFAPNHLPLTVEPLLTLAEQDDVALPKRLRALGALRSLAGADLPEHILPEAIALRLHRVVMSPQGAESPLVQQAKHTMESFYGANLFEITGRPAPSSRRVLPAAAQP